MEHIHLKVWFKGLEHPVEVKSDLKMLPSYIYRASSNDNFLFMGIYYNGTKDAHYYDNTVEVIDEAEFKQLKRKHLIKFIIDQ